MFHHFTKGRAIALNFGDPRIYTPLIPLCPIFMGGCNVLYQPKEGSKNHNRYGRLRITTLINQKVVSLPKRGGKGLGPSPFPPPQQYCIRALPALWPFSSFVVFFQKFHEHSPSMLYWEHREHVILQRLLHSSQLNQETNCLCGTKSLSRNLMSPGGEQVPDKPFSQIISKKLLLFIFISYISSMREMTLPMIFC